MRRAVLIVLVTIGALLVPLVLARSLEAVLDERCLTDLREIATASGYGEGQLGSPVVIQQVSETGDLWGGLACAVFRARGPAASGLVGFAVERQASRCAVSFFRVQPPEVASCGALNAEAKLRLTDLSP